MAAPARTSPVIIARLNREINAILTTPDMREAMMLQSFVAEPSSPADLVRQIGGDLKKWRSIVAAAGSAKP